MRGRHKARRRRDRDRSGSEGAVAPAPEEIRRLVEPVIEDEGFELLDLTYVGGRSNAVLRLVLDHPQAAVSVEDCSRVSGAVGRLLDGLDLIPSRYHLEVSSPGLDRPLRRERDYLRFRGSRVKVVLSEPLSAVPPEGPAAWTSEAAADETAPTHRDVVGQRVITGKLAGYDAERGIVLLETDQGSLRIPRSRIVRARLVPEFPFSSKPPRGRIS